MKILLREIRKLSLRQMENITGISKSALNRIEKGEVSMTLHEAEMVAKGLHIGIEDLYDSAVKHKKCPDIGTRRGNNQRKPLSKYKEVRDMDDCTKERIAALIMKVMTMDEEEYERYKSIMEIKEPNALVQIFFVTQTMFVFKRGGAEPLFLLIKTYYFKADIFTESIRLIESVSNTLITNQSRIPLFSRVFIHECLRIS